MYLMYVDESGDPGNNTLQTRYFCLSAIVVHESEWRNFIDRLVSFRKTMRDVYNLPLRGELHAVEMIRKNRFEIPKHNRLAILRNYLDELAKINTISITNVVVDKQGKPEDYDVFSSAWRSLFQRFENTLVHGNFPGGYKRSFGTVYSDATSGKKLTQLVRKMSVHNPVPNKYGSGYRNIPIHRVIEDPSERDSQTSLGVQSCDVCAYFLHQKLDPNTYIKKKSARNYFDRLDPVLNKNASTVHSQGIVML